MVVSKKRLTWDSNDSYSPNIAIDPSNNIHVVWYDDKPGNWEIYYAKSTNKGVTWTKKRLTWDPGLSWEPAIAIDSSSNIYVVYQDEIPLYDDWEIYCQKSTDGGATWTRKRITWNSGDSIFPALAIDISNNIHVVWQDFTPGYYDIYYSQSTDGGTNWAIKRLNWSAEGLSPSITTDTSNNIYVVWYEHVGGSYEIYYKKSTDGGTSWSKKRLTWNTGWSSNPKITADPDNNIHVVWRDSTSGNVEIYYMKSTDGGTNWNRKRLTWNAGDSLLPVIAIDSDSNIFIVWYDETPGNPEIFFRKRTMIKIPF